MINEMEVSALWLRVRRSHHPEFVWEKKFYCLYFLMIYSRLVLNESYLNIHNFGLPKVEIFYLYFV